MRYKYDPFEDEYLTELHNNGFEWQEIADILNDIFDRERTKDSVKCRARKIGIAGKHDPYTAEQDEWIREHVNEYDNYADMAKDFNIVFGTNKADRGIQSHAVRYLGIVSGRQAFKKGNIPHNQRPVGAERYHEASGLVYVKISDTGIKNKDWIAKQRKIWTEYYGEIPKGYNVIFLDGDKNNYNIENLMCVSDRVNRTLESRHWHFNNIGLMKAAIKTINLEQAVKEQEHK